MASHLVKDDTGHARRPLGLGPAICCLGSSCLTPLMPFLPSFPLFFQLKELYALTQPQENPQWLPSAKAA